MARVTGPGRPGISAGAKLLLLELCARAGEDRLGTSTSEGLARTIDCSVPTLEKRLAELNSAGWWRALDDGWTLEIPIGPPAARIREAKKPEVPQPIRAEWTPPDGMAQELAQLYDVSIAKVIATVPEFLRYWRELGTRKTGRGWTAAWRNRVSSLAKRGDLYTGDPRAKAPGLVDHEQNVMTEAQQRALERAARWRARQQEG